MEHIRQHDWCSSERDEQFILEEDVDNCVTEKILRNKFFDPLILSDSDDESKPKVILNWDEIFKGKKKETSSCKVVPGLRPVPPFIKLSALTSQQHYQCLKVLCSQNPDVMPGEFFPRPTKQDYRVFEALQEIYKKEQAEFAEWARSLWTSEHCLRVLRPKPQIEAVYEAEFKVRANGLSSFPKNYTMVAQIALELPDQVCEITHQKDIISVNVSSLPLLNYPDMSTRTFIMKSCPMPEPCTKHPCRFVLPNESSMTLLPMTEIHKELAQFAIDNGASNIASENALKCLVQRDRRWTLPVSVCDAISPDGETQSVVVLGSEFSMHKEAPQVRTYKAYKRMLESFLISPPEETHAKKKRVVESKEHKELRSTSKTNMFSSDEEDDNLYIDMEEEEKNDGNNTDADLVMTSEAIDESTDSQKTITERNNQSMQSRIDFYSCTCKDTVFEKPPPRSYRRWRVRSKTTGDCCDVIVHAAHKARGERGEVVVEPTPEYQVELGASQSSADHRRGWALALLLRKTAAVLHVRVDGQTGEIVWTGRLHQEDLSPSLGDVAGAVLPALRQLRGLRPGQYLLHHEPLHGPNALLQCGARDNCSSPLSLSLTFRCTPPADADDAKGLAPPTLEPVLLPVHKFRRTLPCSFSPHAGQLRARRRGPAPRHRTPPHAIKLGAQLAGETRKWPKKRRKRRGAKENN